MRWRSAAPYRCIRAFPAPREIQPSARCRQSDNQLSLYGSLSTSPNMQKFPQESRRADAPDSPVTRAARGTLVPRSASPVTARMFERHHREKLRAVSLPLSLGPIDGRSRRRRCADSRIRARPISYEAHSASRNRRV